MKNKHFLKTLSVLLAITVIICSLPISVFADGTTITDNITATSITQDNFNAKELTYKVLEKNAVSKSPSGTGTKSDPYLITTGNNLLWLSECVNGTGDKTANSFAGDYFKLANNIDMNGALWTPIGVVSSAPFCGIFDGGNHEIKNITITFDMPDTTSVSTYYVGFFGYVKNADIKNLGLAEYTIDQSYHKNSVLGGFCAYTESSTITNCYSDGDIKADFSAIDPLERADIKTLKPATVSSIPSILEYDNPSGQTVVLDLTTLNTTAINKTITIGSNVSFVRVIGSTNKAYTGLSVFIEDSGFNLCLELVNLSFTSPSGSSAIYSDNCNRTVYINSLGSSNVISAINGKDAIRLPKAHVYLTGDAPLTISGGDGANGVKGTDGTNASGNKGNGKSGYDGTGGNAGTNGSDGGAGVTAYCLTVNTTSFFTVSSGKGGDGGAGGNGGNGSRGGDAYYNLFDSSTWGDAGNGGHGAAGGNGGDGGKTTFAVNASRVVLESGTATFKTGDCGNGGAGGKGGNGGRGGEATSWAKKGGKGGNAGLNGAGGNAYTNCNAILDTAEKKINNNFQLNFSIGANGTVGAAGEVGTAGSGGNPNGEYGGSKGNGDAVSTPLPAGTLLYGVSGSNTVITDASKLENYTPSTNGNTVHIVTAVSTIPQSVTNASSTIDFSGITGLTANNTVYIKNTVDRLSIIGNAFGAYSGISFYIEERTFPLTIEFNNLTLTGKKDLALIYGNVTVPIYLYSLGVENTLLGAASKDVIYLPNAELNIDGDAALNILGGDGIDGTDGESGDNATGNGGNGKSGYNGEDGTDGTDGTNGGRGIYASTVTLNVKNIIYIKSGNGGKGGAGGNGGNGARGGDAYYNLFDSSTWGDAGRGGHGGAGGFGGKGGRSDYAIQCSSLNILAGTYTVLSGDNGVGGNGGNGGNGGRGGEATSWAKKGGKGGDAGLNGKGGDAYLRCNAVSDNATITVSEDASINRKAGKNGTVGTTGAVGAAGSGGNVNGEYGGSHGSGNAISDANKQPNGSLLKGVSGNNAVIEGNIGSSSGPSTGDGETEFVSNHKNFDCLSLANITVGGFCGIVDKNSTITLCATVINYTDISNSYNESVVFHFAGENKGVLKDIVAALRTDGKLTQCSDSITTPNSNYNLLSANLLHRFENGNNYGYYDDNGVIYNTGLSELGGSSAIISTERYASGKMAWLKPNITLSDYNFTGKFISATVSIKESAFISSSSLQNVSINSKLINIGDNAFADCTSLEWYAVSPENEVYGSDKYGVLYEKLNVSLPNAGNIPVFVSVISAPAKAKLAEYDMPDHIVKISPYAFAYNESIVKVDLSFVRAIGEGAFLDAKDLTTVIFGVPEKTDDNDKYLTIIEETFEKSSTYYTQKIGLRAFKGCSKLSNVNIESDFILEIGEEAFANCDSLSDIRLGKKVKTIGTHAFGITGSGAIAASLEQIVVDPQNEHYLSIDGVLYAKFKFDDDGKRIYDNKLTLSIYPNKKIKIPEGKHSFEPSYGLEKEYETVFMIPETDDYGKKVEVSSIDLYAFQFATELEDVFIEPEYNITIKDYAFKNSAVKHVHLGKNVISIGSKRSEGETTVFDTCDSLLYIQVSEANQFYSSDKNGALFNKTQTVLYRYPAGRPSDEYYAPKTLISIDDMAFKGAKGLEFIVFESDIHYIGLEAFYDCTGLKGIYFKNTDAPETFGKRSFETNAIPKTTVYYTEGFYESGYSADGSPIYGWINWKDQLKLKEYSVLPIESSTESFYAFVITNSAGVLLDDIYVTLTDGTSEGTQSIPTINGIATFYNLDFEKVYSLKVMDNSGVYYPYENCEFLLDDKTCVSYVTVNNVPNIMGMNISYRIKDEDTFGYAGSLINFGDTDSDVGLWGAGMQKTYDINSHQQTINKWLLKDNVTLRISCSLDATDSITNYKLIQNDTIILSGVANDTVITKIENTDYASTGKQLLYLTLTVSKNMLAEDKDVYATVCTNQHGDIQLKLNLRVINFAIPSMDFSWATNGTSITLDKSIPIIGGTKISFPGEEGSKYLPKASLSIGPDYYRIIVGENLIGKEHELGKKLNFDKSWKDFVATSKTLERHAENKIEWSLSGWIEIRYAGEHANGTPDYSVNSYVKGTVKYTIGTGTTFVVIVPIRLDVSFSVGADFELTLAIDKEANQIVTPNLQVTVTGEIKASAGVGCKIASAGIYGNATLIAIADIIPEPEFNKVTFKGDLGVYVAYNGLFIKIRKEWSLFTDWLGVNNEIVIYDKNSEQFATCYTTSYNSVLYNQNSYELAPSNVSSEEAYVMLTLDGFGTTENVYSGMQPQLIQVGDLVYIIYHTTLNGYSDKYDSYNYQKIVYQTYNTKTEEFSKTTVLDDNGLSDGDFDIACNGTTAAIIYSQLNKRLSAEDSEDMEKYASSMEMKTAVLSSNGSFAITSALTQDSYCDISPTIGVYDGTFTAVWLTNTDLDNALFGITDQNGISVMASRFDPTTQTWSAPFIIKGGINSVTDLEIGEGTVAYITDSNNDLLSVSDGKEGYNDKKISVIDLNGELKFELYEDEYRDISYTKSGYIYYINNCIFSLEESQALIKNESTLPEEYTVLTDSYGNEKAILYVSNVTYNKDTAQSGSNVFAIFNNNGMWGKPIQLTDYGAGIFVTHFNAVEADGQIMLSCLLASNAQSGDTTIEIAGEEYTEISSVYDYCLEFIDYPNGYSVVEARTNYSALTPNGNTTLIIEVKNNGADALQSIPLEIDGITATTVVCDENGNALSNGNILSGCSGYFAVTFNPGAPRTADYILTSGEQQKALTLWHSDLAVNGKQVIIGEQSFIIVNVTNNGHLTGSCTLTNSLNGNVVTIDNLAPGEKRYFTISIPNQFGENGECVVSLFLKDVDEYALSDNTDSITIVPTKVKNIVDSSLNVWIDKTEISFNPYAEEDVTFSFDPTAQFQQAKIVGTEQTLTPTVSYGTLTFAHNEFNELNDGQYILELTFNCNNETRYASIILNVESIKLGIPGDANNNTEIEIIDMIMLKRFLLGVVIEGINIDNCDVNEDGNIDILDLIAIKMLIANLGIPGDINKDGSLKQSDIILIKQALLTHKIPEHDKYLYDVNEDGEFDIRDLMYLRTLVG